MISNRSIAGRASALLLFALAAAAALSRGGVSLRAQVLACAGAALALGLAALPDRRGRTPRLPLLSLVPLLIFAMAALQCLPIPSKLLALIAPVNAQLRFMPPAPMTAFAPITLDLPATASSLAAAFALASALMAAALLARRPRAQLLLMAAPIAAALLQLGICFVRFAGQGVFAGTFVNRNHLAGLLLLGAVCAMGAALSPPRQLAQAGSGEPGFLPRLATSRPLWIASAAACAAGTLLTLSRGAAVGLGLGAVVLLALEQRALARTPGLRTSIRQRWKTLWLALPLLVGLAAAFLVSNVSLTSRFADLSRQPIGADVKLRSFIGAAQVALEHPLFGVGRGAWQFVAERHRSVTGDMQFVYVENEPLQLAAEEGLPLTLAMLAIAIIGWLRLVRATRSGLSRGVAAGALALFLQNLVDFNLEFVGVALPLAVALGAALVDERVDAKAGEAKAADAFHPRGWRRVARPLLYAGALLGLCLAPLPLWLRSVSAEREGARLVFEARDPATSVDVLLADAEATVSRHPADWLISLAPAIGLHQRSPRRTAEALAWAGRAQLLGPKSWRPHIAAAAIFLRAGRPAQARVETRLSLENLGTYPANEPFQLAARSSETLDDLLEATPDDAMQRARLAAELRVGHRPALARALVEHELALPPESRSPASSAALRLELAQLLTDAHEFAGAEQIAAQLPEGECSRALILSASRKALGRPAPEIDQPLLDARARCPSTIQLYDLLIHGRLARRDLVGAAEVLDDPMLSDSALSFAAQVHVWRAELEEARGELAAATHERWLAALLAPDEAWRAIDYADRLRAQGDLSGALAALRTLDLRATGEARAAIDARITALEKVRAAQRGPPGALDHRK